MYCNGCAVKQQGCLLCLNTGYAKALSLVMTERILDAVLYEPQTYSNKVWFCWERHRNSFLLHMDEAIEIQAVQCTATAVPSNNRVVCCV